MQITVLPPVPTDGWTVEELDERVDDVRNRYLDDAGRLGRAGPRADGRSRVTAGPTGPGGRPAGLGLGRRR